MIQTIIQALMCSSILFLILVAYRDMNSMEKEILDKYGSYHGYEEYAKKLKEKRHRCSEEAKKDA